MKLLLENWRKYLLQEARGDRETSAIATEVVRTIANHFKDAIAKKQSSMFEYFDLETYLSIPLEIEKLKSPDIDRSGIVSKIEKLILNIQIDVQHKRKRAVEFGGGAFNHKTKTLIIDAVYVDKIDLNDRDYIFGWIKEMTPILKGLIQHELEHGVQAGAEDGALQRSDIEKTMDRYSLELGRFNTKEKIVHHAKSFMEAIFNFFQSNNLSSEAGEQYARAISEFSDDLKVFRELTPDSVADDQLVLYYLQPIEIEAYSVGFYREARELIKNKDWLNSNVKDWENKSPRQRLQGAFDRVLTKYTDWLIKPIINTGLQVQAGDAVDTFRGNVLYYSLKRYPMLSSRENIGGRGK
jgi:hypothetical protein